MALTTPAILPADSVAATIPTATDSIAATDTVVAEHTWGLVMVAPKEALPEASREPADTYSWVVAVLILLFVIISIRVRNTRKFLMTLISDLTDIRVRHNMFDTTVRETSLLILLCFLTGLSGAMILSSAVAPPTEPLIPLPHIALASGLARFALCAVAMAIYLIGQLIGYKVVGFVFADSAKTRVWIRGYGASMGLLSLAWLPCALLLICRPEWQPEIIICALVAFCLAKLIFIWKGFRIFFAKVSSWVLFLYYLCSLEAVPVILVVGAVSVF